MLFRSGTGESPVPPFFRWSLGCNAFINSTWCLPHAESAVAASARWRVSLSPHEPGVSCFHTLFFARLLPLSWRRAYRSADFPLRACLETRPVRGPGLQPGADSAVSCRPRARTRRFVGVSKQALRSRRQAREETKVNPTLVSGTASAWFSLVGTMCCHVYNVALSPGRPLVSPTLRTALSRASVARSHWLEIARGKEPNER